jgi:hypothetical protein
MKGIPQMRSLVAVLLFAASTFAQAIPVSPPPSISDYLVAHRNGNSVDELNSTQTFSYDSDTDLFTYLATGINYYNDGRSPDSRPFENVLAWSAHIDDYGNLVDSGSMLWFGDFGDGVQLISAGYVKAVGISHQNIGDPTQNIGVQALLRNEYLNPQFVDFGLEMFLSIEAVLPTRSISPFMEDFGCMRARCDFYFSSSGLYGLSVSEPSNVPLVFGTALWILIAARSRMRRIARARR